MSIYEKKANILENNELRIPQKEGYRALYEYFQNKSEKSKAKRREVSIILPVGCGKSGLIAIAPFAVQSKRTLVVAPGVQIADQLYINVDPTSDNCFYIARKILTEGTYPEPVKIKGKDEANFSDLEDAEIVITNIQQLQGEENQWLTSLPEGFFDLIQFDEGHHNTAESWQILRKKFPDAKIVNYSATPMRFDGQKMEGKVIYSYPVVDAIHKGYIKKLKAIILNPKTLKYVKKENNKEIEVSIDKIRELGETDSDFRRSIVTSDETLNTIVDASINELKKLRQKTGENRLKIIASSLNHKHCIQIVKAYRSKGQRAEFIHTREKSVDNQRRLKKLENHELDVIVQVKKLGEGFDHPFLSVAAIFSIFGSLSPFIQFIGRIMRTITKNDPKNILNNGSVIFHAGGNIARRWTDFKNFSQADQDYFNAFLPDEELDFTDRSKLEITPENINKEKSENNISIKEQGKITLETRNLLDEDKEARKAFEFLKNKRFSPEEYKEAFHKPVPTTKISQRKALRKWLDDSIKHEVGRILQQKGINPMRRDLDKKRLGKTNFEVLKSILDKEVNKSVGKGSKERHNFSKSDLEAIKENFPKIVKKVEDNLNG